MPLDKSGSKVSIGKNIKEEEKTKPRKQAIAIALNVARKGAAKISKKGKK
jgi:ribosomal protein L32E